MTMSSAQRDFYVLEYERIADEVVANEAMGEGRVALFFGVWSVSVAAVASMTTAARDHTSTSALAIGGLVVVALLGIATARRIIHRNHKTDALIDALTRIRALLTRDLDVVPTALPWDLDLITKERRGKVGVGLLEVVGIANATIPALAVISLAPTHATPGHVAIAAMSFVGAVIGEVLLVRNMNEQDRARRNDRNVAFAASTGLTLKSVADGSARPSTIDVTEGAPP